jgi:NDMA-dependent alcohol dehydrogenase
MKTRGAVLTTSPGKWEILDIDLDEPRQGELQLRMVGSGLCHSDDHSSTGALPRAILPVAGGHEGAGIVSRVGPNTPGWEVGDHVLLSFLPACGRCRWCASGMQNLCDLGAHMMTGRRIDGSLRMNIDGLPIGQMAGLSTFCEHTVVDVRSCIKVDKSVPLDVACLIGCAVGTGWGSAVYVAQAKPGQTILIMGIGGIGINAVQGAKHAGASHIIAVDPVAFKRESAKVAGATHCYATMVEATEFARSVTNGQGADAAVVTTGVLRSDHVSEAFASIRKGGTVVVTAVGKEAEQVQVPSFELTLYQKRIQGAVYGGCSPTRDIPWLLRLYAEGRLLLDELVTTKYTLEEINVGYADMNAGKNIRGVVVF